LVAVAFRLGRMTRDLGVCRARLCRDVVRL
jgi:hypothetical protein